MKRLIAVALVLLAAACASPLQQAPQPIAQPARIVAQAGMQYVITSDGYRLPLHVWAAEDAAGQPVAPKAVIVALHGFNDYAHTYSYPAPWWAKNGITTYAYDQRSFGATESRGIWPGSDALIRDMFAVADLVRDRHPGVPLFLHGNSMGGAVVLAGLGRLDALGATPGIQGAILTAPAVWGRPTMNPLYRIALWGAVRAIPARQFTGAGLNIRPSDNIPMLITLGRDPIVIKGTRVDAIYGLTDLMDEALAAAPHMKVPLLVLYGAKDEIIPKKPTQEMIDTLGGPYRVAVYPDGYHLLLRDLQGPVVWNDELAWIVDQGAPLPSGAERTGKPLFLE